MSQRVNSQDASDIAKNSWRQGSVLPKSILDTEIVKNFLEEVSITQPIGIVVSQDCDVVHSSFDTEPLVEILLGEIKDKLDPGLTGCKSPRKLHVEIISTDNDRSNTYIDFDVNNRIRIDRKILCDYCPDQSIKLSDDNIHEIRYWVSFRYLRPAFPDAFGERIQGKSREIKKLLKKESSSFLSCIYLSLLPDTELSPDDTYNVLIAGCMQEERYQNSVQKEEAEKLLGDLKEAMNACRGINVIGASCDSERALTLHDMRYLKRWSAYDHITIRESSASEIPPSQ